LENGIFPSPKLRVYPQIDKRLKKGEMPKIHGLNRQCKSTSKITKRAEIQGKKA
jgi:hypothetical protein